MFSAVTKIEQGYRFGISLSESCLVFLRVTEAPMGYFYFVISTFLVIARPLVGNDKLSIVGWSR